MSMYKYTILLFTEFIMSACVICIIKRRQFNDL